MHRLPGRSMNELNPYQPQSMQPYSAPPAPLRQPAEGSGPLQLMWRRRWIVVACLLLCIGGAIAYLRVATPLYTSYAKLTMMGDVAVLSTAAGGKADATINIMEQQLTLMSSTPVIQRALKGFDTTKMVTFADGSNPENYIKKNLIIIPGKQDGSFTLSFDAPDPKESADLLNAIITAYIADRIESNPMLQVLSTLDTERKSQKAILEREETALMEFRKANGELSFVTVEKSNPILETLAKLNDALSQAQIELMAKRVEYAARNDKARAYQELLVAEGKVRQLQAAFEQQQKEASKLNEKAAEYDKLVKQVGRTEALVQSIEARIKTLELEADKPLWLVRRLEDAIPSVRPSKPEKPKIFALAVVLGLMLGFGGAWVREKTDHRLSSADEIAQILGLPVLTIIPSMPGRSGAVARGQKMHLESMSDVAEAFRTLRTVVYFSVPDNKAKTILLTSPFQGEGKSTTASGLAIAMAKAGRRTLMIDGDLRKPTLHRIFEMSDQVGLSSVMAGRETLENAIGHTAVDGLDILPCGPIPANPSEILNSRAFADLLQKLGQRYDHIVIDSPPVLPVTDARILGATCDVTLLVLRANRSTRRMSEYAAEAMLGVGARVLGVVVNDVPRSKRSGFYGGYGYGNYGYGKRGYEVPTQLPPASNSLAQKRLPTAETPAA